MFRRIGWQVLLVSVGFLLAAAVLAYVASTYTTEFRPAPGGTYVEAIGGYPQTLNPLLSFYNDADSDVVSLVFSGLTRIGMQGQAEPDLASSWTLDPSGITYTFRLNRDVIWHDGSYFTADDVLFTIDLLRDPDYPGPPDISALWRAVETTKIDDYTVRFVLPEAYAPFLDYTTIGILPQHILRGIRSRDLPELAFNREPVGTGPFRLAEVEVEEGQITRVSLRRFARYYGRAPLIESLELRFYPTLRAAFEAYQSGAAEGISRIPLELIGEAYAEPQLNLYSAPTAEMVMLYLNETLTETLPFADARVRRALFAGLDRQLLVDQVLRGQAIVPQSPLLPGTWAYDAEGVSANPRDLRQAQVLLAEAGWRRTSVTETLRNAEGQPLAFSLAAPNDPTDLAVAAAIAQQWANLGIAVTVEAVPPLALSGVLDSRSYQAALVHLVIPGDPDPYPFWHETQILPGQGQNYAGFQHRRISEIVEEARVTVQMETRQELYREFQQLFMKEVPALPLYVPIYTYGLDARVGGAQLGPMMRTGDRFRTVADWYVLQRRVIASQERRGAE